MRRFACALILAFAYSTPWAALCNQTTGTGTALARAAANLSAGQWCQMDVGPGANQVKFQAPVASFWDGQTNCVEATDLLCIDSDDGTGVPTLTAFTNKMPWDPIRKQWRLNTTAHHAPAGAEKHIIYDDATNTWSLGVDSPDAQHGYEHSTVNPATGDTYYRKAGATSKDIYRWTGSAWSLWDNTWPGNVNLVGSIEWFPERGTMYGILNGNSPIRELVGGSGGTWTDRTGTLRHGTLIAANGVLMHFGDNGTALRFNVDGTTTSLAAPPCPGNSTSTNAGIAVDPVSQKIIFHCGNASGYGTWHEYNTTTGATVSLPNNVGTPGSKPDLRKFGGGGTPAEDETGDCVNGGISSYGVIGYLCAKTDTGSGGMYIYKHSAVTTGECTGQPAGTACTSDFNPCTVDQCNGVSANCVYTPTALGTACDDTLFCNGADTCNGAGVCTHAGDPCSPVSCDEVANQCQATWFTRSTAAGVTMATNFDQPEDVFDFIRDAPASYAHETSIKLSGGGSLKILLPDSDGGAGHDWWRFLDDDMIPFGSSEPAGSPAYTLRGEYWLSYAVYMPQEYYDWIFNMTGGGKKFSITSGHPLNSKDPISRLDINFPTDPPTGTQRTGSSVSNELVITDTRQTMHVQFYIQNINGSASWQNDWAVSNPCSGTDRRWLSVDAGVKTGTPLAWAGDARSQACRNWNAQFGPSFWYSQAAGHSYPIVGQTRQAMAQPWPDPIAAGKTWRAGWNTILYHVIFPSTWTTADGTLEAWMWHPGDTGWTKLFEKFDVVGKSPAAIANGITLNNGVDGYFHWGLWLTPFRTGGVPEVGIRPNTFIIYDEVIVSTQAIVAPTYGTTGPLCGNLVVEAGEDCDYALTPTCCESNCTFSLSSTPCASDGDACTADFCSGTDTTCVNTLTCMRVNGLSMLGVVAK